MQGDESTKFLLPLEPSTEYQVSVVGRGVTIDLFLPISTVALLPECSPIISKSVNDTVGNT